MSTSLADLLDTLGHYASSQVEHAEQVHELDHAVSRLGRGVHLLAEAGLSVTGPCPGERERWAYELAAAAQREIGATRHEGRAAQLAGAITDTIGTLQWRHTTRERWAALVSVTDVITDLRAASAHARHHPAARQRAHAVIDGCTNILLRLAAIDPPNAKDLTMLDRRMPGLTRVSHTDSIADLVADVNARLRSRIEDARESVGVAEISSLCFVADELTRFAAHLARVRGDANYASTAQTAAAAWTATRRAIRPYNDGTRRPHGPGSAPAVIVDALRIHSSIRAAAQRPFDESAPAQVHAALRHLPELSVHVRHALRDATSANRMIAYGRDLPYLEEREAQFVAGRTAEGIVTARLSDVRPILAKMRVAHGLASAIATLPVTGRRDMTARSGWPQPTVQFHEDALALHQQAAAAAQASAVRRGVVSRGAGRSSSKW